MDEKEITALAREYAEERASVMQGSLGTKIQAELVIRFLHRRFCLVEKSIILDEYKDAVENIEEATAREGFINLEDKGKKDFIESLFPEIAKEVER